VVENMRSEIAHEPCGRKHEPVKSLQMNDRRWPLSSPSPGRGREVAPEPAYIHCSWNVNNDQFCPHDRPEACRTKCEGVCGSVRGGL
jgi:hypothetical protein